MGIEQIIGRVVAAMNESPQPRCYVSDLTITTGLGFAQVYDALIRLEGEGIVTSGWEPPVREGGARRRWYALTNSEVADEHAS